MKIGSYTKTKETNMCQVGLKRKEECQRRSGEIQDEIDGKRL